MLQRTDRSSRSGFKPDCDAGLDGEVPFPRLENAWGRRWAWVAALPLAIWSACPAWAASQDTRPMEPHVFLLNANALRANRAALQRGDRGLTPALAELEREANAALHDGPFSVVEKTNLPPSGDKHDYMSFGPYWWPNPNTANGLPYIRHDGRRNPATRTSDRRKLGAMIDSVETLALAYYFSGKEAYAEHAALLLRTWFLDPATRMNPNFQFAQAVPGRNTGRGIGLIETAGLTGLVDAVGLLAGSKTWTDADQRGLQQWFEDFLNWMQVSKNGQDEAAARNNHGTYYDLQVASYALFVGKEEIATNVLRAVGRKRIARQIEPDGRQPLELARTNAWHYSLMNLRGLMSLARLGENLDVDLWHYKTPDGRSLRKALDCLIAFADGDRPWPTTGADRPSMRSLRPLLQTAARAFPNANYGRLLAELPPPSPSALSRLIQPAPGRSGERN